MDKQQLWLPDIKNMVGSGVMEGILVLGTYTQQNTRLLKQGYKYEQNNLKYITKQNTNVHYW